MPSASYLMHGPSGSPVIHSCPRYGLRSRDIVAPSVLANITAQKPTAAPSVCNAQPPRTSPLPVRVPCRAWNTSLRSGPAPVAHHQCTCRLVWCHTPNGGLTAERLIVLHNVSISRPRYSSPSLVSRYGPRRERK